MAPPRSCFRIGVVGIVAGITLHGCDEVAKHVHTLIETACTTSVSGIINSGRQQWIEAVTARCQQLKDQAQENLLNEEKAEQLYQNCINAAGNTIEDDAEAQEDNFTKECLAKFEGLNNTMNPMAAIQEWIDGTDFSGMFQNVLEEHVGNSTLTLDDMKEQFPDLFAGADGSGDAGDNKGGDNADSSGGDAGGASGGDAGGASGGDADDKGDAADNKGGDADGASGSGASGSGGSDGKTDEAKTDSGASDAKTGDSKKPGRLFDVAIRVPHTQKSGYAVLSCLLGCALAAAVALTVVLRRRKARASDHDRLMTAEESE